MKQRILIVDDENGIRNIVTEILGDEGYEAKGVASGEEAIAVISSFEPSLIIMDQNMPGMNGIETMVTLLQMNPSYTVIILTAYGSIPHAVEAIKKGAFDYLSKPFDNDELILTVKRALLHNDLKVEVRELRGQLKKQYSFDTIISQSPPMQKVFDQISRVCSTDTTVLVQGDSGTGKELVARAIHFNSGRKGKSLVSINCGAIPVQLIESELFGHEAGAFTDAKERKIGSFEKAQGGTLFLDEIGELPLDAQVKLLRVLEDKCITRVGANEEIPVDIRIIAATNKNLEKEVEKNNFRIDLLYRLNVFTIHVPPLSDRSDDIPLLVEHFIDMYNKNLGLSIDTVTPDAFDILIHHSWPGNVRDLENAIQSAMIVAHDNTITVHDLPLRLRTFNSQDEEIEKNGLECYIARQNATTEKEIIQRFLSKNRQSKTDTASSLKISRKTLFNKMKQYDID